MKRSHDIAAKLLRICLDLNQNGMSTRSTRARFISVMYLKLSISLQDNEHITMMYGSIRHRHRSSILHKKNT